MPNTQTYWFTYDAENRTQIANGALVNGQVQLGSDPKSYAQYYDAAGNAVLHQRLGGGDLMSTRQEYDARGQLVRQWYEVDTTAGQTSLGVQETRTYDAAGHLLTRNDFVRSDEIATWSTADGPDQLPVGGYLYQATASTYDTDGRLTDQVTYVRGSASWYIGVARQLDNGTTTEAAQRTPPSTPPPPDSTTYGALDAVQSALRGQQYDAAGNVQSYIYVVPNQFQNTYTLSYLKREGYLEQATAGTSSTAGYAPATTSSSYDAWGRLTKVQEHITPPAGVSPPNDSVRYFAGNGDGQIVSRRDGELTSGGGFTQDPDSTALPSYVATGVDIDRAAAIGAKNVHYTYVAGQPVAHQDEAGLLEVAGVPSPTAASEAGSRGSVVVQAGDTLGGLAQRVYGNAGLWYVIADANALEGNPDDALTAGIRLTLPSVSVDRNDAQTFKPYDPAEIVGSTTPSLPYMPPPPPHHCNTLAMIVVIAVVIVATVMTAGAAAVATGASGSLWTAGSAVLLGEGGLTAASLGAAALGGFAGSVAGQLTGKALGVQEHFSLRQAVGAGVSAAITAGLGHFATGGETIETLRDAKNFAGYARIAGTGAAGTLGSYAGKRLVGEEAHFNWANLVASSVSAAATARLGLPTGEQQAAGQGAPGFWTNVEGKLVQDTIGAGIDRALGADAPNSRPIVEDAFGNALANRWGQGIQDYLDGWSADHAAKIDIETPQVTIDRPTLQVNDLVPDRLAGPAFVGEPTSSDASSLSADGGTRTEEVTLADGRRVRATVAVGDIASGPTSADQAQWAQGYEMARASAQAMREDAAMQWKRSQETLAAQAYEARMAAFNREDSAAVLETMAAVPIAGARVVGKAVYGLGTLAIDVASLWMRPTAEALGVDLPYVSDLGQALHNGASGWDVTKVVVGGIVGTPGRMIDDFRQGDVVGSTEELLNLGALVAGPAGLARDVAVLGDLRVGARVAEGVPDTVGAAPGATYSQIVGRVPGTVLSEADALNPGVLPDSLAETFSGGRYASIQLDQPLTLYRAWTPGQSKEFGAFWSLDQPTGSLSARMNSALLPEWGNIGGTPFSAQASQYTTIEVPAGTTIHVGEVSSQGGPWVGGQSQILIDGGAQPAWKTGGGALQ